MANKSISSLTAATGVSNSDLFVLEQGGTAKKLTGQIFINYASSAGSSAAITAINPYVTLAKAYSDDSKRYSSNAATYSRSASESASASATSAVTAHNERLTIEQLVTSIESISSPLVYKGVVSTVSNLPQNANVGDVYYVTAQNSNYAYNGSTWDNIGISEIDGGTF